MTLLEQTKNYRLVEQAIHILEQQSKTTELALSTLAAKLNTSPGHLQRVFTAWAGISPKQFFHCLQKDHARSLLLAGNSLLNATLAMGYSSSSKLHHLMITFEALSPGEIKKQGEGSTLQIGRGISPFGEAFVCLTPKGINSLEFQTESLDYLRWQAGILQTYPKAKLQESGTEAQLVIDRIFKSISKPSDHLAVHLRGTPFQLQVWQALLHLPPGQLASYHQIACGIDKPSASRAVGSAIAKNPIAFLIPCHRVIQSTGELGQYRWDSTRKKALHIWEQGLCENNIT